MNAISGPVIQIASGAYFSLLHPEASKFGIRDIAHALSHLCRYTGHCRKFYSVAQHSVLASYIVPPGDALAALLHDASEAFIGDVARPLKRLLPDYAAIEKRVEKAVLERFGLAPELPESVHYADRVMLATEKRDLLPPGPPWALLEGIEPMEQPIHCWSPRRANRAFVYRYAELTREG